MKSINIKRSIVRHGQKTSVSLENEFWDGLREIASQQKLKLSTLVSQIDKTRAGTNLSSAIRDHREITKGQTCPAHRVLSLRKFDSRLRLHRAECRAVSANQPPLLCAPDSRIACLQFCCFPRCRDELGCCPFKIRRFFLLVGTNKVANFFAKKA